MDLHKKCPTENTITATDVDIPIHTTKTDAAFCPKLIYNLHVSIGIHSHLLTSIGFLLDTGAKCNLINVGLLHKERTGSIKNINFPRLCTATKEPIQLYGTILPHIQIGGLPTPICFGISSYLSVSWLLGTTFVDCFLRGIFPGEPKVLPWLSKPKTFLASYHNRGLITNAPLVSDNQPESFNSTDEHLVRLAQQMWIAHGISKAITVTTLAACLATVILFFLSGIRQFTVATHRTAKALPSQAFHIVVNRFSNHLILLP